MIDSGKEIKMTNTTDPHTMRTVAGRIRAVYTDLSTGREYYIVDGQRIYLRQR